MPLPLSNLTDLDFGGRPSELSVIEDNDNDGMPDGGVAMGLDYADLMREEKQTQRQAGQMFELLES